VPCEDLCEEHVKAGCSVCVGGVLLFVCVVVLDCVLSCVV
jgi:hypothetical protein